MTGLYRTCCPPAPAAGRVVDAVVLPRTDYTKDPQLLLLLEDTSSSDSWILRIVTLPGLESEYELRVGGGSALVPLAGGVEAMVFLEPDTDARAIKIKTIIDGVPEARLRKLISKQKFDEALKFARLFKLDASLVAKGKAFYLLQQLKPYRLPSANSTAFMDTSYDSVLDELLGVLDGIQDVGFVGRACVGAMLPTVALTDALLAYAARRLANPAAQEEAALREQVGRLQQRMGTFLQLQPADADVAVWAAFSAADPLQLCTEHLAAGELSMWGCIWRRHQHELAINTTLFLRASCPCGAAYGGATSTS
ncbi:uncharacterized protein LOC108674946 [Hyalella azteca]|uniref:Uncharacterized protein LOC108674946 n=1 Tax=Hyalella azteca TaxID=294128 RepID=A0A979FV16_HYAAZ|nr:uncharacterized protein LOC108674946 [Hyalella azteca]